MFSILVKQPAGCDRKKSAVQPDLLGDNIGLFLLGDGLLRQQLDLLSLLLLYGHQVGVVPRRAVPQVLGIQINTISLYKWLAVWICSHLCLPFGCLQNLRPFPFEDFTVF